MEFEDGEQFMEVDCEEGEGWFDEEDEGMDHFKDPKLENHDSNYAPKLTSGFQYIIIDEREVSDRRQQIINEVKEIIGITEEEAQVLLIKERFDKDGVLQKTFD